MKFIGTAWLQRAMLMLAVVSGSVGTHAQTLPPTCRNPYTQAQEIALGDKVVQEVYRTQPVLPDSDPVAQFVRQLGAQLVAAAPDTPGLEQQWPFNFHVVASSEINAFALPGGTMFVNLGAIQAAQTDAQLAGVMAHEMSHVILRHSTCNLVKQQHRGILYGLAQIGAAVALGGAAGDLAAQGIGLGRDLSFLKMSRGDEQQADMLGVRILHDAGFDARGLPQFFEIILAKTGSGGAQFLSDHPNPGNRTEYLNREIATLPPLAHPIVTTAAFRQAHAQAAEEHALSATEMKAGAWRASGLYATGPGGVPAAMPVSASAQPGADQPAAARLSATQLDINAALGRVQGPAYAMGVPPSWHIVAGVDGGAAMTIAPAGAQGSFGLSYGVSLDVVRQGGAGVAGDAALRAATDRYAADLAQRSGLVPEGAASATTVNGQAAMAQFLRGRSPVSGATAERDWLVTVARPDGDLDTILFTAPADQWAELQPLFARMLASFRSQ